MTKRATRNLHTVARVSDAANATIYRHEYDAPCEAQAAAELAQRFALPALYADDLATSHTTLYAGLLYEVTVYRAE